MKFKKPSKPLFIQKLGLFIGSFSLALVLWIFVVSENDYTMIIELPIEARNLSSQKAHKKEVPTNALVRLKGTGRDLFKSFILKNYAGFKLVLDLEGISQEYEFILNEYFEKYPQKVVLPLNYNMTFVEVVFPSKINISLDDYSVKTVPIISNVKAIPAPGYVEVGKTVIKPTEIEIAGPKKELALINHVETLIDTLLNLTSVYNGNIKLKSLGRLIDYSEKYINLKIDIQNISERIVADIPVEIISIPQKIRVFPSPQTVSLTVVGGINKIATLNPNKIKVIVDFSDWRKDIQFYEPNVILPEDILNWKDISPKNIEIAVAREL